MNCWLNKWNAEKEREIFKLAMWSLIRILIQQTEEMPFMRQLENFEHWRSVDGIKELLLRFLVC